MANLRANKIYGTSGPDANGSALFNGTDYLTAANAAPFRVNQGSTEDFTIEAWIYVTGDSYMYICGVYESSGNQRSYQFYLSSDLEIKFNYADASSGGAGSVSTLTGNAVPQNEWVHVAVAHEVSTTTLRLFQNGINVATDNSPHTTYFANTTTDFFVGKNWVGNISNLHITLGTCKYTGDFDPYKLPIDEDSNTTVLCLNSSIDVLNDDKSNTFTQTATGGVKASTLMPFNRSDAGVVFQGDVKINSQGVMYFPTGDTSQRGRGRGVFGGGYTAPANTNVIEYFEIQSGGKAQDFGDLNNAKQGVSALSSSVRGLFAGGGPSSEINTIDYVTLATTSNATDFGDLTAARKFAAPASNSTRGVYAGGETPTIVNTIDYVTIATVGNAADFGDLATVSSNFGGCSSATRGVFGGGDPGINVIEYVTIATTGNATDFGDLTAARRGLDACSSSTRGLFAGGLPGAQNTIDYITIASAGNAADFGDLRNVMWLMSATSSHTRGVWAGGYNPSSNVTFDTMDSTEIATLGNAVQFGTLISKRRSTNGGTSDCHGGLS